MKKFFVLCVSICVICSLAACDTGNETTNTDSPATNQTAETSPPATQAPTQTNKGVVDGKYEVEIVSARTANDYQGKACIIVKYNFTNKNDANAAFLTSVGATAFQNSVQCAVATTMPDVMDAQPSLAQVQPGGTLSLECAYGLQDITNPVTIQVGPLVNISGKIDAQMIFNLTE